MTASFPMYEHPKTSGAYDRLWRGIREELGAGPERLTRSPDLWSQWEDPELMLSQTCGLPLRTRLRGKVTLVATPDYGVAGCEPGYYCSVVVCRTTDGRRRLPDFADGVFAANDYGSQSGWAALVNEGTRPSRVVITGSHMASAVAVAEGRADYAALDAKSWMMIEAWEAVEHELRVFHRTTSTPGLPLITANGRDAGELIFAIETALQELSEEDRQAIGIRGVAKIPLDKYLAIPTPHESLVTSE
jgi:ABC-type phosphate/phosphonate transport system substrate-binding protein